jgi:hypothetical protein
MKEYTWNNSYDSLPDGEYVFQKEVIYPYVVFEFVVSVKVSS